MKLCAQTVTTVDTTGPGWACSDLNLVPNGSFEQVTNCPNMISVFNYASPWFTPTSGTSDLYSGCAGQGATTSAPTNSAGYYPAASGGNYAGAFLYSIYGTNPTNSYREYLEVPLLSALTPGQQYLVSFKVRRLSTRGWAIADIGAAFLPMAYTDFGPPSNLFTGVLPFQPAVSNPTNNIITSTNTWTLIQGVHTAIGWENHLVLGNFKDDPSTTTTFIGGDFNDGAYYLFDDVSVTAICNPAMTNKTVACGQPFSLDPFPILDACAGTNLTLTSVTTTSGVCPRVIERTWTATDLCGNSSTLTQKVTIVDTNPPTPLCGGGVNLAPNPQFENFSVCPYFFSQVSFAAPWFNPTVATPDYLNSCTTFWPMDVPTNLMGSQTPFSGNGYFGAFAYSVYGTNPVPGYREYIEAPLLTPMQAGTTYLISFRVSLADTSGWGIAQLGAHFSTGPALDGSTQGPLNVTPQFENPASNLLTNKAGWTLVQGFYTATGGEDHVTLGNFRSDANTTAVALGAGTNHTYYYYDDIAIVPLCNYTNKTVPCGQPWTFDEPAGLDDCSGTNVAVTILSTVTNNLSCPLTVTRTWALTDLCGNVATVSQTVTNIDTAPPIPQCAGGNNLVPNGQFESFTQCPTGLALVNFAAPWYPPTDGTSDYFNACATPGSFVNVSSNFVGIQTPYSGNGYMGAYTYSLVWNYREYLQVPLLSPLVANQTYPVSFRVSLADNVAWAVAEIGAHFSVGAVLSGNDAPLNLVPQVANVAPNFLTSTNGWMLIQGNYTAVGGETHLTLGNFLNDASTTVTPSTGFESAFSYYYFDDVRVEAPCNGIAVEKVVPCGAPWEFDSVTGYDACSGTNITITSVTVTNTLCPLQVTRTWTLTDACGNSTNVSQMVIVTDPQPPVVNCDCLLDAMLPLLSTNGCAGVIPNFTALTNSNCLSDNCGPLQIYQFPAAGTVVGPGSHPILVTVMDCGGNSTNCNFTFQVNAPVTTLTGPPNIFALTCSNSLPVSYTAFATNNVGPVVFVPPSGTHFPLGTNFVTAYATNVCGGVVTHTFKVVIRPARMTKWGCLQIVIGIPYEILNPTGGSAARQMILPNLPDGGHGSLFENLSATSPEDVRLDLDAAEALSFTTVLDFGAPLGARVDLAIPPAAGSTSTEPFPLLSFVRSAEDHDGWHLVRVRPPSEPPASIYRTIAVGTNGEIFSSHTLSAAALDTNVIATLAPMNGVTEAVVHVTVDALTHGVTVEVPNNEWMPSARHKGWDGCIYGPDRPIKKKTNSTARVVLTPVNPVPSGPLTNLALITSNLTSLPFYNPTLQKGGRKWSDGHVTLLKAYDAGTDSGMDFTSLGDGGGVGVDLGHAAGFSFRRGHFHNGDIPDQNELYRVIGWPPGTTTNRPPPPTNFWRFTPAGGGAGGPPGVELAVDFTQWGVSNVTLQLWDGPVLVAETNHIPATLAGTVALLPGHPQTITFASPGVLKVADTNRLSTAVFGLACSSGTCEGDELRIVPELSPTTAPPEAFTRLECVIGDGMDLRIGNLQTTPACTPAPLTVTRNPGGIVVSWIGDGFRLQGAERLTGPWYELGVNSPATIPANSPLRVFRLRCD
jgi:hypothetical protein